jgi:NADPH:quinone reductase-like Zn-dependent oxidoreductase
MKAMICTKYGSPDVLQLVEVEKPVPKDNELLVKIRAASVNALDWHMLRGKPFLVRLQYGFFRPKVRIMGYDIAGQVEAVGKNVTQFKPGDEVFGGLGFGLGGFAEYACIAQDGFVALLPSSATFVEAAAVPAAAATALKDRFPSAGTPQWSFQRNAVYPAGIKLPVSKDSTR